MRLLIAGDFYISDSNPAGDLFDPSVVSLFDRADYRIVNLEAPITADIRRNRILKTGPHLRASQENTLAALRKLKIDLVTLANNHIMDYGSPGLQDTLASLRESGIETVGAGRDGLAAASPYVLERDDLRVAFLNFAENEWSTASRDKPGANPLDLIENVRQIQEAKKTSDYVIVIIHGGHEYMHFPSPERVRRYRYYAENGASMIVGHHPHCVNGCEVHGRSPILYSLGNFVFTRPSDFESWYTGLVLSLCLKKDQECTWELIPVVQSKNGFALTLPQGEARELILRRIEEYGKIIVDDLRLGREWESFLSARRMSYVNVFSPLNIIRSAHIRVVLARLGWDRFFLRKSHYADILNNLRCESHAEAAKTSIEDFLK